MSLRWLKKGSAVVLSAVLAAGIVVQPGEVQAQVNKTFGEPVDLGPVVQSVAALDSAYGVEDGHDVMYTTVSGTPAVFNVVDLDDNKLLRTYSLPGAGNSWSHITDAAGNVYIAASNKLFRYSPASKQIEDFGAVMPGATLYGLSLDEAGNVYMGTYPESKVFKFDPATKQFHDYGSAVPGQQYVRGLAYYSGDLYAGVGTTGSLVRIDADTGERTSIPFPDRPDYYDLNNMSMVFGLTAVRDLLFVHVSNAKSTMLVYDMTKQEWLPETYTGFRGLHMAPEHDGKTYFVSNGKLMAFDLTARAAAETGIAFGTYLRHSGWVDLAGDPDYPGKSLVTVQYGGQMTFFNPETKKSKTLPPVVLGQPTPIQNVETGPDGKIYSSGYMGTFGSQYDPVTGLNRQFNLGQAEGITSMGNKIYFGTYPGATVYEFDTTKPPAPNQNPKLLFDIGEEQDRPFAMTSGEGKLFAGTISDYGHLGGALTVYDGTAAKTYRNIVENQSIIGLAYKDGKIYGSTTVWGGLGIQPTETEAKVFVWDVAGERKVAETVPDLPNIGVKAKAIGGLSFGPDGLLWGASYGTIFAMDPETLKVVKSEQIFSTDWNFTHNWRPVYLKWGADGTLYTTVGYHIVVIDPETLDHVDVAPEGIMTLGKDGNIYYADGGNLKKIEVKDGAPPQLVDIPVPVANNSFEEPLANGKIPGWESLFAAQTPNAIYQITDARSSEGGYSLVLKDTSTTETVGVQSAPIPVSPGTAYTAKTRLYLEAGRTVFVLRFYDANGKELISKAAYVTTGAGKWQDVEVTETAPQGAASLRIIPLVTQFWMTTAYYDDIRLSYKGYVKPKPALDLVSPTASVITNDTTPNIVVKAAAGAEVRVYEGERLVGSGTGAGEEDSVITLSELSEGEHRLTVVATDAEGTSSDPIEVPLITVDTTAPSAPMIVTPERPQSTNDASVVITVRAEQGAIVRILDGERVISSGTGAGETADVEITTEPLAHGIHKGLTVTAIDAAGNESPAAVLPHLVINNGNAYGQEKTE